MLVLAILDYSYQKYKISQALKMTKQEVKDEMKNMDGDPHIQAASAARLPCSGTCSG